MSKHGQSISSTHNQEPVTVLSSLEQEVEHLPWVNNELGDPLSEGVDPKYNTEDFLSSSPLLHLSNKGPNRKKRLHNPRKSNTVSESIHGGSNSQKQTMPVENALAYNEKVLQLLVAKLKQ